MARKSSTTLPPVQPVLPSTEPAIREPAALPPVTFSPEKLAELLNMLSDQKAELAAIKASMVESNKRKLDATAGKPAPTMSVAGKTDKAIANEILTVKLFKKQGFSNVVPHVNVKTFNRWMAEGRRPIEGSKSIKVNNLRLFHVTQTREVTAAEKKANAAQQAAAVARHDKAAKTAKVVPINANPQ